MSPRSHHQARSGYRSTTWVVIGLVVVMLLVVAALVASSPPSAPSEPATVSNSTLASSERAYDFGTISMAAGKVTKTFAISNDTSSPIIIRKLYTSCMCTVATLIRGDRQVGPFGMEGHGGPIPTINEEIPAGERAEIEVIFDPTAHGPAGVGAIVRNVIAETADGKRLIFAIKARVTP